MGVRTVSASTRCSTWSASPAKPGGKRRGQVLPRHAAAPRPGASRCSATRRCWSSTSRPTASTPRASSGCAGCSATSPTAAARCCCPRTCCTRSRRSPTSSSSSAAAGSSAQGSKEELLAGSRHPRPRPRPRGPRPRRSTTAGIAVVAGAADGSFLVDAPAEAVGRAPRPPASPCWSSVRPEGDRPRGAVPDRSPRSRPTRGAPARDRQPDQGDPADERRDRRTDQRRPAARSPRRSRPRCCSSSAWSCARPTTPGPASGCCSSSALASLAVVTLLMLFADEPDKTCVRHVLRDDAAARWASCCPVARHPARDQRVVAADGDDDVHPRAAARSRVLMAKLLAGGRSLGTARRGRHRCGRRRSALCSRPSSRRTRRPGRSSGGAGAARHRAGPGDHDPHRVAFGMMLLSSPLAIVLYFVLPTVFDDRRRASSARSTWMQRLARPHHDDRCRCTTGR